MGTPTSVFRDRSDRVTLLNSGRNSTVRFCAYLIVGFFVLAGNGHVSAAPVERSVSASRQFIVYGTTTPLRGAVSEVAERTKASLLNLLQQRDGWRIPIILNLQFPQANEPEIPAAELRFSQTGAGLKIQLDLTISSDFDALALRRQLLRVILLEIIYRQSGDLPAGSFYVEPPGWLIEGILAADSVQDWSQIAASVNPLVQTNRVATLEEFLRQRLGLLDSAGQLVYRAYALAFVQLLLNESDGPVRLSNYISNLSRASSDPLADLQLRFPVLGGGSEVDALWKNSVANLDRMNYELFTAAETERQLDELLAKMIPKLASLARKRISKTEAAGLRPLKEQLILLGVRANPMLKTLVFEYEEIVAKLSTRKTKGLAVRLTHAEARRKELGSRSSDIDDYMNWFEVTKSGMTSGAFSGYLRAAARAHQPQIRRRDPLSVYLDALEAQY